MSKIGGYKIMRGDRFDPECGIETYTLRTAYYLAVELLGVPERVHSDHETVEFGVPKHSCDYRCECRWPEWATVELFDDIYLLTRKMRTLRGNHHKAEIARSQA